MTKYKVLTNFFTYKSQTTRKLKYLKYFIFILIIVHVMFYQMVPLFMYIIFNHICVFCVARVDVDHVVEHKLTGVCLFYVVH